MTGRAEIEGTTTDRVRDLAVATTVDDSAAGERAMVLDSSTAYLHLSAYVQPSGATVFVVIDEEDEPHFYTGGQLVVRDADFEKVMTFLTVDWSETSFSDVDVTASVSVVEINGGTEWNQHEVGAVEFDDDVVYYELEVEAGSRVTTLNVRVEQLENAEIEPDDIVFDPGDPVPDPGPTPPPGG